ncbi:MAG TPA: T9SS type A sorting domain-containing protein, partial [Calditrichaeota bacterium]|nr:T9SS type A sorting domain-containing protein [Calditrichota bacterium]
WRDPQPHVFRSTDMGQSWQDISANLPDAPVNAFAVDTRNSNILYLGSDIGAFVSFDAGGSWQVLGEGLPAVVVNDMKVNPESYELIVGTHGRSMYKIDLTAVTGIETDEKKPTIAQSFLLRQNYPNPFNPATVIRYRLPVSGFIDLSIYNITGQIITTLVSEKQPAGWHNVRWEAEGQPTGMYIYRLKVDGKTVGTGKMILLR